MKVIKRDGREIEFDANKIRSAITKAFVEVDSVSEDNLSEKSISIINRIVDEISSCKKNLSVEQIQDMVESKLMASKRKDVAKAYILYRDERTRIRHKNSEFMRVISKKINASDVQYQNANVDEFSFGGRKGEADSELMRRFALDNCMSEMARNNHLNNEVYIHDLDSYAVGCHNCLSIPFDKLLSNGFNTRQTDVRPAQSINTAFQLLAVIFQLQSLQQFGGVSATHLDWTMVPYVRKSFTKWLGDGMRYVEKLSEYKEVRFHKWLANDSENHPDGTIHFDDEDFKQKHPDAWQYAMDMTERELYQAVEGMYHNLNTLQSRSGNQLPFTSINYGTCILPEGRMVTKALLDASIAGVGKLNKTAIFPCGIFQYMKGVNDKEETPNYDLFRLALQSTSLRLYPNYANVDWSGNAGYDKNDPKTYFSTMGKRKLQLI